MEDQCTPLTWPYFFQEEEVELKQSLLYTALELENTIVFAQDEIAKKDEEILQLKNLLARFLKERDDALAKCQSLNLEKLLLHQQLVKKPQIVAAETTTADDGGTTAAAAAPVCNSDENVVAGEGHPPQEKIMPKLPFINEELTDNIMPKMPFVNDDVSGDGLMLKMPFANGDVSSKIIPKMPFANNDISGKIMPKLPLPEQGKFLQAVMEAGPLLQTLLLAGPLPQWQHPPPHLNSVDIPPVTISAATATTPRLIHQDSALSKKRLSDPSPPSSPNYSKFQKVLHQSSSLLTCNI